MDKLMKACVLLIILTLSFTAYSMSSSKGVKKPEIEEGYQTLRGRLFEEGTGTVSMLIFEAENGNNYLVEVNKDLKQTLRNLKALPLLLTGKVTKKDGTFKIGPKKKEVKLYSGKLEVEMYNTYYDEEDEEVSILGTLQDEKEGIVLLTPDQQVIYLDPDTYHSLDKHIGKEAVINGELERINEYRGEIKVNSFRIIE